MLEKGVANVIYSIHSNVAPSHTAYGDVAVEMLLQVLQHVVCSAVTPRVPLLPTVQKQTSAICSSRRSSAQQTQQVLL